MNPATRPGFDVSIMVSRAEPSRAEPSRAEPSRAEPSRAEPSRCHERVLMARSPEAIRLSA